LPLFHFFSYPAPPRDEFHGLSNRGNCTSDSLSPLTARSDFGADDGGAAPMRMLAPPRTPMIRAYPPDFPLRLRDVPPYLGRQG